MSQQINLISPLLLKKRFAFGLREMVLGVSMVLTGALAWAGYLHYQAGRLETQATQMETRQAKAQQELDHLAAAANRPVSVLLTERVQAAQAQVAQREALLASINGIMANTSAGFSPRLRALAHSTTQGVWLNGFTISPEYVALKGSTLNADLLTAYLDKLGKQPSFSGMLFSGMKVELASSVGDSRARTDAQSGYLDFSLYSGSQDKASKQGIVPAERGQSNGQ